MEHTKSSSKRETYGNTGLPQERRKKSNKQCNLPQKVLIKGRIKPKVSKRKEIIKIRMEINDIQNRKTTDFKKSMKSKAGFLEKAAKSKNLNQINQEKKRRHNYQNQG